MKGERHGKLVVVSETRKLGVRGRFYVCRCDCGRESVAYGGHLRAGVRKSCGCSPGAHRTHGLSGSAEYKAWDNARARCHRPTSRKFDLYGGRGIEMCPEWRTSFAAFFEHIGPRPGSAYSLDRIDNDRGYEPGNVRWATTITQNLNRRPLRPREETRRGTSG